MADALVLLPLQRLGLDADSCSTRGSFLADQPPLSPIQVEKNIFQLTSCSGLKDVQSFHHSDTVTTATISRQPSFTSACSSATASRMYLSLSASTRGFFGHEEDPSLSASLERKINSLAFEPENVLQPMETVSPLTNNSLSNSNRLPSGGGLNTSCQESNITILSDGQSTALIENALDSSTILVSNDPRMSSQGCNLSYTTGSLKYSRKSIITTKPQCTGILDEATLRRMRKRRDLIDELLQSEEIYISELKTLLNVYFGPVSDGIYPFTEKKATFIRTIGSILDLHERLYQAMQNAIPRSFHARHEPLDADVQLARLCSPFNSSNPAAAALVANTFAELMKDLLVYEDFISKYDTILKDGCVFKCNPHRRSWERDCELLANSFLSKSAKLELSKRALAFEDLLMKPIQRICKYPLFFTELLRVTPVIDCPESNSILDRVSSHVKDTIYQLDMAKDNSPKVRDRLERNWLLQKRLTFRDNLGPQTAQLGQVVLCGTLYAVWRDSKAVQGDYLACLLYKSYLLLATVSKSDSSLNVILSISLTTARVENAALGTGIQCHNAPFSWAIIFEHDFRVYEVILCAWNAREEQVWRKHLEDRISLESKGWVCDGSPTQRTLFVRPIACNIEPSGNSGGYQGSLKRHWSFHGSVAPSPKIDPYVVSIQNTWAPSEPPLQPRTRPTAGLSRSSSVMNVNTPFTLSSKRSARSRLESSLMDVWSKDQLPLGASSWLLGPRKFSMGNIPSMASITSTFGRKSSQVLNDTQTPVKPLDAEHVSEPVVGEKRGNNSLERAKKKRLEQSTPTKEHFKEQKTPMSPIWSSWGPFKGKEISTPVTDSSPTLIGDKTLWKRKRWSNPGNVVKFFECDTMFANSTTTRKVEL